MALVNVYCIYEVLWNKKNERNKPGLLKKLSDRVLQNDLFFAWGTKNKIDSDI